MPAEVQHRPPRTAGRARIDKKLHVDSVGHRAHAALGVGCGMYPEWHGLRRPARRGAQAEPAAGLSASVAGAGQTYVRSSGNAGEQCRVVRRDPYATTTNGATDGRRAGRATTAAAPPAGVQAEAGAVRRTRRRSCRGTCRRSPAVSTRGRRRRRSTRAPLRSRATSTRRMAAPAVSGHDQRPFGSAGPRRVACQGAPDPAWLRCGRRTRREEGRFARVDVCARGAARQPNRRRAVVAWRYG